MNLPNLGQLQTTGKIPHLKIPIFVTLHMEPTLKLKHPRKTLLVVDDDPTVLKFVSGFLDGQYNVLIARSGAEGLRHSKEFKGEIHLLLTDFQMAGMSGIELATQLTAQRPTIKVLMMSGFSEGMLVLNEGWHFLAKPFIASQLQTLITGLIDPTSRFTASASN
jgi:DNA-binding NtrC family response regulator